MIRTSDAVGPPACLPTPSLTVSATEGRCANWVLHLAKLRLSHHDIYREHRNPSAPARCAACRESSVKQTAGFRPCAMSLRIAQRSNEAWRERTRQISWVPLQAGVVP
jgi:hypothetical protein